LNFPGLGRVLFKRDRVDEKKNEEKRKKKEEEQRVI
jgi:hypothetical protein